MTMKSLNKGLGVRYVDKEKRKIAFFAAMLMLIRMVTIVASGNEPEVGRRW